MNPCLELQFEILKASLEKEHSVVVEKLFSVEVDKAGYNQGDTKNNNYKNGSSNYRRRALEKKGKKCCKCGSTKNIIVDHKDGNRKNNALSNLQVVCASCHENKHKRAKKG